MTKTQKPFSFSIEVLPKHLSDFVDESLGYKSKLKDENLKVFITHINGTDYKNVLDCAQNLMNEQFVAVPHLAVRNIKSEENIAEILNQIRKMKITSILLLGGDNPNAHQFESVLGFINEFNLSNFGIKEVYLSTFPEGHPHQSEKGFEILKTKTESLNNQGIKVSYLSQLCFDGDSLEHHYTKLKISDSHPHLIAGFSAPCKLSKLVKMAISVGVSNAMSFLSKGNFMKLFDEYDSDEVIKPLINKEIIDGVHCYCFGNYKGGFEKIIHYSNMRNSNLNFYNNKEVKNGSVST